MIGIKTVFVFVAIFFIAGVSILGIIEDVGFMIACGLCEEGQQAFFGGVADITSAGQNQIRDGVEGMVFLQENEESVKAGSPIQFDLLLRTAQYQIWGGLFLSLAYIFIFFVAINFIGENIVGFYPPRFMSVFLAVVLVGLITWWANGFQGFPYDGWITLVQNPSVFQVKFIEGISPIPLEGLGFNETSNVSL